MDNRPYRGWDDYVYGSSRNDALSILESLRSCALAVRPTPCIALHLTRCTCARHHCVYITLACMYGGISVVRILCTVLLCAYNANYNTLRFTAFTFFAHAQLHSFHDPLKLAITIASEAGAMTANVKFYQERMKGPKEARTTSSVGGRRRSGYEDREWEIRQDLLLRSWQPRLFLQQRCDYLNAEAIEQRKLGYRRDAMESCTTLSQDKATGS